VVEERLRLAREIHDVVGHSLTVVALQAGAARRMADTDPVRAGEVMRTVAEVVHEAMAALLAEDGPGDLARPVDRVVATGLAVDADLAGEPSLTADQRAVAVRVVQEALTNVLRHAPGAQARVSVRSRPDGVEVVVTNTAPAGPGAGSGSRRGLEGLRERVSSVAGAMSWGGRGDGGFEVRALLPASELAEVTPS
jgi:signal transduction histidine kinase